MSRVPSCYSARVSDPKGEADEVLAPDMGLPYGGNSRWRGCAEGFNSSLGILCQSIQRLGGSSLAWTFVLRIIFLAHTFLGPRISVGLDFVSTIFKCAPGSLTAGRQCFDPYRISTPCGDFLLRHLAKRKSAHKVFESSNRTQKYLT